MRWNELISYLTGLGVVTTPAVALWLAVALLNLAIKDRAFIAAAVAKRPRAAAALKFLEGSGFDPEKVAESVRDALVREEHRLEQ